MNHMLPPIYAGMVLSALLLASTPDFSQQVRTSTERPQSILSLAPAPRPEGLLLARHPGEATFERPPANYHVFAAATVGRDAGVEALTLNFAGDTRLTRIKSKNNDFVIEPGGTCHEGNAYTRGGSCSLLVRFNPHGPGHRLGFINVTNSTEAQPMILGLTGNGYSPVVSFTPSLITTVPVTVSAGTGIIKSSTNLAVDGGDIIYIADVGNDKIREIDSSGNLDTISLAFGPQQSIAVDTFGLIYGLAVPGAATYFTYYYPTGTQTGYSPTYAPGSCTPSTPCNISTVGLGSPASLSIDPYDNLFFTEKTKGAAEMPVGGVSGSDSFFPPLLLWYLSDIYDYSPGPGAESFAVDANDNIYDSYLLPSSNNICWLLEESLYNAEFSPSVNRVAGGSVCGFSGDGGQARGAEISSTMGQITFDIAGNLYFADTGNQRVRRIDASTGIISTIAGNGIAGYAGDNGPATKASLGTPTGVAVDSQGQVYILSNAPTAGPTQVLRKVGTAGYWNFGSVLKGTASAPEVFTLANTGNFPLTLSVNAIFRGANPTDFVVDPGTTNCVLTAGATIQAGRSCRIGMVFKPSSAGSRSASVEFDDNTVNGSNTITMVGLGTLPTPTMTITSPAPGSSVKTGTSVTFSVTVTSTATTKPTGTVTFKANGATIGSPVTLSSAGLASTTFSEPSANTYTLSAVYSGDANYATATVSESIIVTAVKLPVNISLTPVASPSLTCGALNFSAKVTSTAGGVPTGTVALQSGRSALASSTLQNGAATLSVRGLPTGLNSFVATYSGDSLHQPGTSTLISVTLKPSGACSGGHRPITVLWK
jgi:hypothetical protein